jgi:transcriptional regulator with XRE-family HTH domain
MKTIKQIADEIGVSKQAVSQKIKKEPLSSSLRKLTQIKGNTVYISEEGETLIKSTFSQSNRQPTVGEKSANKTPNDNQLHDILTATITALKEQLEVKDKQIESLTEINKDLSDVNKSLADSINAEQKNKLAETLIDGNERLIENGKPKKKGFFRIFSRGE